MATPRKRRHQRTKQAILDAAREIINEEGPGALSMRTLADRIDYSPAGLYEYYGSKEEIFIAVAREGHERLRAYMRRADSSLPVQDYLLEIGLAYIRFARENPDYFLLMFNTTPAAATDFSPEAMQKEDSSYLILLQAVQRGIDEGVFSTSPSFGLQEMAYTAWATVHGIAMLQATALRHYPHSLEEADRQALHNFTRGLLTAPDQRLQ